MTLFFKLFLLESENVNQISCTSKWIVQNRVNEQDLSFLLIGEISLLILFGF